MSIQSAIDARSVVQLRNALTTPLEKDEVLRHLTNIIGLGIRQYYKKAIAAELLFWCDDDEIHTESSRSRYPKVLKEAIDATDESAGFYSELKATGQKVRRLRELIDRFNDFDPNRKDSTGNSAMHYASDLGLNSIMVRFLPFGADLKLQNRQGLTPLEVAAKRGRKLFISEVLTSSSLNVEWDDEFAQRLDDAIRSEWWISTFDREFRLAGRPAPEGFVWCVATNRRTEVENARQLSDGTWAQQHYVTSCPCCGAFVAGSPSDRTPCSPCREEDAEMTCEVTGERLPLSRMVYHRSYQLWTKSGVYVESKVRGYHSRPRLSFFKQPDEITRRYFGFELELVLPGNKERVLSSMIVDQQAGAELYMNSDGSIGSHSEGDKRWSCGYELISHPMTLAYASTSEKLKKAFFCLRTFNAAAIMNRTLGLHIHVSRRGFKDDNAIRRVHSFIYKADHRDFVVAIAGRDSSDSNYTSFNQTIPPSSLRGGTRYEAINYQNTETLEFRLFKGGVGLDYLLERIEFLDALIEFCSQEQFSEYTQFTSNKIDEFVGFILSEGTKTGVGRNQKMQYRWPNLARFVNNLQAKQKSLPFIYVS
jgi:hypothetical protein